MAAKWTDELNPAQRQAATHDGGPALVVAGAGTGKTKTLACRVAWLIENGTAPDRILLLTFTRRAAAEMVARAGRATGRNTTGKVWGGTFHATANRLLRQYGSAMGLAADFTVMDQADAADLMNLIRGKLALGESKRRFPKKNTLIAIYSRSVNSRTKLGRLLEEHFPWCQDEIGGIRQIFELYTTRKREQNVLDYDDLLLYWKALCSVVGAGDTVRERFDHILVDEYQDTNLIQAEILQAMSHGRSNIMVVGDDAQSIYSFRAATVRNILDFPDQFAGAKVIKLEKNYRSTQPILDASNAVMAQARKAFTKNLYSDRHSHQKPIIVTCLDEDEQCHLVCDRVLEQREQGVPLRKQAVLFRAGHHSDQLEVELSRRNIPFVKYGGLKFVEAAHVKDMLAILRILENPRDELSWFRVLNLLEGIGPVSAGRIIESIGVRAQKPSAPQPGAGTTVADPLLHLVHRPPAVPPASRASFTSLCQTIADCLGFARDDHPPEDTLGEAGGAGPVLAGQLERIRRFYEPIFDRLYENGDVRARDLDQLELIAGRYKTRSQFITDLTLDPPTATQDLAGPPLLDEDFLILSTIHSAKGCEWNAVHIIHAADGMIPSDMATGTEEEIEEERRLLYVAMTRARDTLNIYFPLRYYASGRGLTDRHSYAQLTRFIPASAQHLFERVSVDHISDHEASATIPSDIAAEKSIDAMLDELWRD